MPIVALALAALLAVACDPGPLPQVPHRVHRGDYKKDWFPSKSEDPLPLDIALQSGDVAEMRRLLDGGADPNARWSNSGDRFPLQEVLEGSSFGYRIEDPAGMIGLLLERGADPSMKWCPFESRGPWDGFPSCTSAHGVTPLMLAAIAGRVEIVELLLGAGADAGARNWAGGSALDYAYDEVAFEMISRALFPDLTTRDRNALKWLEDANLAGIEGLPVSTPLTRALRQEDGGLVAPPPRIAGEAAEGETRSLARVRTLLRIGANPNQRIESDRTPLSIALARRAHRIARVLLVAGADVNQRWCFSPNADYFIAYRPTDPRCTHETGITPLMWAAADGDEKAVTLLLEQAADVSLRNWMGLTAADVARSDSIRRLLTDRSLTATPPRSR